MTRTPRTRTPRSGRAAAAVLGTVLLLATGGGIAVGSLNGPLAEPEPVDVPRVSVPAGDFLAQCPATARLVKGATGEGTDPAFAPDSDSAKTAIRATVLSDPAERIPGASLQALDGKAVRGISTRLDQDKAAEDKATGDNGFTGRKAKSVAGVRESAPTTLRVQPLGGQQSTAAAVRSYTAGDGDLAGLAASRCQSPANEQWLTGASTTVGSTALLVVSNPSASASTVDLDLFGGKGRIEAGNTRGLVIAPGESKSIVLAGLAAGEKSLSVKVTSTGAPVTAVVQQSTLRGLTPGGVDFIEPAAAPAERQVVPGVAIQNPKTQKDISSQKGYGDAVPMLNLTVPGATEQLVRVHLYGTKGEVKLPRDGQYAAGPGATTTVDLTGIPAGNYTAVVESDEPVAASVRMSRGTKAKQPVDAAWAVAAQRLGSQHLVLLPEGTQGRLVFGTASGTGAVEVRPVTSKGTVGKAVTLTVNEGRTVERTFDSLGKDVVAVTLSASGDPVYGGLVATQGKAGIASLGIAPATQGASDVRVDLRY